MGRPSSSASSLSDTAALLVVAREAAQAGAAAVVERIGNHGLVRTKSSATDPVTEADEAGEAAIRAVLAARRPDDWIVGEEGDDHVGSSNLRWFVDPLDGTVNFLYGMPQWCVSVAVADGDGPLVGVVLDPCRGEEFAAVRGEMLTFNGAPFVRDGIHTPAGADDPLSGVMLATGLNYDEGVRGLQGEVLARLSPRVRDIRRGGSAALDLCWAAIGRVDAYFEHGVRAWDVAAGGLICQSAGLTVLRLPAGQGWPAGIAAGDLSVVTGVADALGVSSTASGWPAAWID
ncbi:MAG: inositol monophosphatase [Actinobacteria bacterium]|uniref:inositol-phosphate phosphatase n=1 Tax=freshwater metagenome TaxID=449393 RepID=A0A6J7EH52_9ZZZZ|nr:inositol monophosphatase [Actinomycetota bacterium]